MMLTFKSVAWAGGPGKRARRQALWLSATVLLSGSGCSAEDPFSVGVIAGAVDIAPDGDRLIGSGLSFINRYAKLAADAKKGDVSLNVSLGDLATINLTRGDLLMVIQMQGARIKVPADVKDSSYGEVTDLGGAGLYEIVRVANIDPAGIIAIEPTCGGLRNDYSQAGKTQLVRIPQYRTLTVSTGATVSAPPWNGATGGIVAFRTRFTTSLSGTIDVSGRGFRGGAADRFPGDATVDQDAYFGTATQLGAEKGESVAGYQGDYDLRGGRYGRGAPANGGRGGNSFKAGGGGGAGAGAVAGWTGQGAMSNVVLGANAAWPLDPAYVANGNARTSSPGGGRGGYSQAGATQNPLVTGPGDAAWAGNLRRERGGLGGRPLTPSPQPAMGAPARLFSGGGGGAGDGNNLGSDAGSGGAGGGIVYLSLPSLSSNANAGKILAGGQKGGAPQAGGAAVNAAAGGGGGGGSVLVDALKITGVSIDASGGTGGEQASTGLGLAEAEGPGGGGSGGLVAIPPDIPLDRTANGGPAGTTLAAVMNQAGKEFPVNGATQGAAGLPALTLKAEAGLPSCIPVDLAVKISNDVLYLPLGGQGVYTITVTNNGPYDAYGVQVNTSADPPLRAGSTWTCAATAPGAVPQEFVGCGQAQGVGNVSTNLLLPSGGTATFTLTAILPKEPAGTFTLSATATPPGYAVALNPAVTTSSTDPLVRVADLGISTITSPTQPERASPMTYLVRVTNRGPTDAGNLRASIKLPSGTTLTDMPGGGGWTCTVQDLVVSCTREQQPTGVSTIRIPVLLPDIIGTFYILANVTSGTIDPDLDDNESIGVTRIVVDREVNVGGGISCGLTGPARSGDGSAVPLLLLLLVRRRRYRAP